MDRLFRRYTEIKQRYADLVELATSKGLDIKQMGGTIPSHLYVNKSGMICAHGRSIDTLCIIPQNLGVQPMVSAADDLIGNEETASTPGMDITVHRDAGLRATGPFQDGYERSYGPGSIMQNMVLEFKLTWEFVNKFAWTGIITRTIPDGAEYMMDMGTSTEDQIRDRSMAHHNEIFATKEELWGNKFKLNGVLKRISKTITQNEGMALPNVYVLNACRGGDDIIDMVIHRLDHKYAVFEATLRHMEDMGYAAPVDPANPDEDAAPANPDEDVAPAEVAVPVGPVVPAEVAGPDNVDEGAEPANQVDVQVQIDPVAPVVEEDAAPPVQAENVQVAQAVPAIPIVAPQLNLRRSLSGSEQPYFINFTDILEQVWGRLSNATFIEEMNARYFICRQEDNDKLYGWYKKNVREIRKSARKRLEITIDQYCLIHRLYNGTPDRHSVRLIIDALYPRRGMSAMARRMFGR